MLIVFPVGHLTFALLRTGRSEEGHMTLSFGSKGDQRGTPSSQVHHCCLERTREIIKCIERGHIYAQI